MKNKKYLIVIAILAIVLVLGSIYFVGHDQREKGTLKDEVFTAYVKINPLVKLTFKSSYYECTTGNGKVDICGKYTNEVVGFEYLNDDAQTIYKDIDLKGKTLNEAITSLIIMAEENDCDVSNVNVTTNWEYDLDNINKDISLKLKEKNKITVDIKFNYQKKIDEKNILADENIKSYVVRFDTDGGTNIDNQVVIENRMVVIPVDPKKDGYTFVEWQLDNNSYDFNSPVDRDFILKAVWKSNDSSSSLEPKDNNQSQVSKKEQDNETLKKQLKEKGLTWDAKSEDEAYDILTKWSGGYSGEIIKNSYGESDIAYSIKITLNTVACGGNEILDIDWHNKEPEDFIYYLHSLGYNCSGNQGYYNNKHFIVNDKNELVFD
ncbi:MAG: InlB B-repeat-containing protein [Tenericutes bacterium]|nr:InlB B-repeat-containing protein [Mycoplasmatota bacterium]